MISKFLLLLTPLWVEISTLTIENQFIIQLLALDPKDPLYVEKFLRIKAIDPTPAVPPSPLDSNSSKDEKNRERDLFAGDQSDLIQEILKVQANRVQGKLPQPPYLVKHPRRGYHHPLALSPEGIPVEFLTLEDSLHVSSNPETIEAFLSNVPRVTAWADTTLDSGAGKLTLEELLKDTPLDT